MIIRPMGDKLLSPGRRRDSRCALQNGLQIYGSPAKIQIFLQTE
jgi:hypothetical protein